MSEISLISISSNLNGNFHREYRHQNIIYFESELKITLFTQHINIVLLLKTSSYHQLLLLGLCPYYCMDASLGRWQSVQRKKKFTTLAQGCFELYQTNPWSNIRQNSNCTATCFPSRRPSKLDEQSSGALLKK